MKWEVDISGVLGNRHVKTNNKYLTDYESTKPSNYQFYFDASILYGWTMSKLLPADHFKWEDTSNYRMIRGRGNIFEVDLDYTDIAKDLTFRFRLATEKKKVNLYEFIEYQSSIIMRKRH